jgi:NAD(P)-dependent dehydrogenase (short-subunit alcohol dehydrogenase family)
LIDIASTALAVALEKVKAASPRPDFKATVHVLDIANEAAVDQTLDDIRQTFGRIDYAVNNAGVCESDEAGVATATTENWRKMIGVNLGERLLRHVL